MFSDFEDGIVALTLQVSVDNQSDEMIYNDGVNGWMDVNNGEARYQSQGALENSTDREIQPGEIGDDQLLYVCRQEYYDIYADFNLEVRPLFRDDVYLFKSHDDELSIP